MWRTDKIRVMYVMESLASLGGAERIVTDKMNWLAATGRYDVTAITCYQDRKTQPNAYPLSADVVQSHLEIPYYKQYKYPYPIRLFVKWWLYRSLKRELEASMDLDHPDIVVCMGYFKAAMVCAVKSPYPLARVVESHEARSFLMADQGLGRSWLSRLYMKLHRRSYCKKVERRADVVVTLTDGDARLWQGARRVEVIPNFSVMPVGRLSTVAGKRVVAVGRLEWQKGFDRLLQAWQLVEARHPDWQLDIYGSGTQESLLKAQIARLRLAKAAIHPYTKDISTVYSDSSIFVLSSHFEGFSLVLLEAQRHGLPAVVFDCPFGPAQVLSPGKSGFVVPDGDVAQMADRICTLIADEALRRKFGAAAVEQAATFDADKVMGQWDALFKELYSKLS